MVSLSGAIAAEPIVATVETLQTASNALAALISGGGSIFSLTINCYTSGANQVASATQITFTFDQADSQAILNDIKNIIANQINIQTNTLGAIT